MPKTFTDDEAEYMTQSATHHWLSIDHRLLDVRTTKWQKRPCSVDRTVGDAPANVCDGLQHGRIRRREENRKEFHCTQKPLYAVSEAETTNNKRLRSTFGIEAIQTRSIARPLYDSRASCSRYEKSNKWRYFCRLCGWPVYLKNADNVNEI